MPWRFFVSLDLGVPKVYGAGASKARIVRISPSIPALLLLLPLLLGLEACASGGSYRNGVFRGSRVAYRLDEPGKGWERISFSENDLAWAGPAGGMISVNAECEDHGDPSLKVLTDHLLIGFEDRQVLAREPLRLAGRGALRTRLRARLDGVPTELELTVLKKDGCVYDLIYLSSPQRFDGELDVYRRLVGSFETLGRE